jgi:hypothetical protein
MTKEKDKDHLFISYATEDWALAEWLTLRLTSEGYRVWCDRFELLGGESYPRDIQKAMKERTFRVLFLLSHNSVNKPNPTKERTFALKIGEERSIDFLIPLKVDEISGSEINWMTTDITYIPFHKNWADGYRQLLKKLSKLDAPRPLEDGMAIASQVFFDLNQFKDEPEPVYSNCLKIIETPRVIKKFYIGTTVTWFALLDLAKEWPIYPKNTYTVFAFHDPSDVIVDNFKVRYDSSFEIANYDEIEGISTDNIVKNLLTRSLNARFIHMGLDNSEKRIYFPFGLLEKNKIHFQTYTGRNTTVQVAGTRKWSKFGQESELYRYHLSPRFLVRHDPDYGYLAILNIGLYLSDTNGTPLKKRTATARGRRIRKSWWNHEWFSRYLATISFISEGKDSIIIGDDIGQRIVANSCIIKGKTPISVIDEEPIDETVGISIENEIEEDIVIEEEDYDYDE